MAKPPGSRDRLSAALAVCDLNDPEQAWAFLRHQGLVRGGDTQSEQLARIVRDVRGSDIDGPPGSPTPDEVLVEAIRGEGLATGDSARADPDGRLARAGWREFLESRGEDTLEWPSHCTRCGTRFDPDEPPWPDQPVVCQSCGWSPVGDDGQTLTGARQSLRGIGGAVRHLVVRWLRG